MNERVCKQCEGVMPTEKRALAVYCSSRCRRRAWNEAHPGAPADEYQRHREDYRKWGREYYRATREQKLAYQTRYAAEHREAIRTAAHLRYEQNKGKWKEWGRRRWEQRRAEVQAYNSQYYAERCEELKARARARHAVKRGGPPATFECVVCASAGVKRGRQSACSPKCVNALRAIRRMFGWSTAEVKELDRLTIEIALQVHEARQLIYYSGGG